MKNEYTVRRKIINVGRLNRLRMFLLLAMILCFADCTASGPPAPPKPPLRFPFAAHRADARIESELRIVEKRRYTFALDFMYKDQADRARVKKLVGESKKNIHTGKYINTGIPIPLRLKVIRIDTQGQMPIFDKEITEQPLDAWGSNNFEKKIADIMLDIGHYKVAIENMRNVNDLEGTEIYFKIVPAWEGK